MTLLWMDSFERYKDTADLRNTYGNGNLETTTVKNGLQCLSSSYSNGAYLYFIEDQIDNQIIVGCWIYVNYSSFSTQRLIGFMYGINYQALLGIVSTGELRLYRGVSTTLGTSTKTLNTQTWYFVEAKIKIADSISADDAEIRVNGETWLILPAGTDTRNYGSNGFNQIFLYNNSIFYLTLYDDLYICNNQGIKNNDFLGPIIIDCLKPNGNGASSQWDGSDGNQIDNYLLVDDLPRDTGTYIEAQNASEIDLFNFENLSEKPSLIHGVKVTSYIGKVGAGDRLIKPLCRSGGTNYEGSIFGPGIDLNINDINEYYWENNPNGDTNWLKSTLESAEFGVKVES